MKKILAMLLALLTLAPSLIACSGGDTGTSDTSASDTNTESTAAETTAEPTDEELLAKYVSELPDKNFDGYEFTILTRSESAHPSWFTRDVYSEAEDGDPINDAVFKRNRLLEENLGVIVKDNPQDSSTTTAKNLILSGEDSFDVVTDGVYHLASTLANAGYLIDYNSLDSIELKNEWWDQRMNSEMTVLNKLYFVTGDISIMDNEGTWQVLFNKELQEQYSLSDYYELRDNGSWTLDVMLKDATAVSKDLDGDGAMKGEVDQFGLATEDWNTYALWAGSGEMVTRKNDEDLPEFTIYNERSASVVEKALDINGNKEITMDHNLVANLYPTGRMHYQIVGMRVLPVYRQSEVDFGILPLPKYNEQQDRYYSVSSNYNLTAYGIPVTASDPERTAFILEAMAGTSFYTLTPAYYEISLMGKYIRDDESAESIELILANRSYDLAIIYNWGNPTNLFRDMTNQGTRDFSSRCAALETNMNAAIDQFVKTIEGLK